MVLRKKNVKFVSMSKKRIRKVRLKFCACHFISNYENNQILVQARFSQKQCFQKSEYPLFCQLFMKGDQKERKENGFYPPLFRNSLESCQKSEYSLCKIIVSQKKFPVHHYKHTYFSSSLFYPKLPH